MSMRGRADRPPSPASPFSAAEHELIRRELDLYFGQYPSLAEGLFLRSWRGGPNRGEPKTPPAVRGMLERGLVEIQPGRDGFRAVFTAAGLASLRQLLQARRAMDPVRFAHLR